jgi:transposase InsO family protein
MIAPPFQIAVGLKLDINGRLQEVIKEDKDKAFTLRCPLMRTQLVVTHHELLMLRINGKLKFHGERELEAASKESQELPNMAKLSDEQKDRISRRVRYAVPIASMGPMGPKNPRLHKAIEEIADKRNRELAENAELAGTTHEQETPPAPHSVYRWVQKYRASNYDSRCFMRDVLASHKRKPKLEQKAHELLEHYANELSQRFMHTTVTGLADLTAALTARDLQYTWFRSMTRQKMLVADFIPTAELVLIRELGKKRKKNGKADSDTDTELRPIYACPFTPRARDAEFRVSRETIRKIFLKVDRHGLAKARFGRQTADALTKPRGKAVVTFKALERVEADHFVIDCHLICAKTHRRLGRPWLTVFVDHYSGCVLGWYLSFTPPCASSVIAGLKDAILPAEGHAGYGIPDLIVVDNGPDLASERVRLVCDRIGSDYLFCAIRSPWKKGVVERLGRTLNTRVVHWLDGTTLGEPTGDRYYNGADHACVLDTDFADLIEHYFKNFHNKFPSGGRSASPEVMFERSLRDWPARVPVSLAKLELDLCISHERVLQHDGLRFYDLQYQCVELMELFNRVPRGQRFELRVDPTDLQFVHVKHPLTQDFIKVPCQTEHEWPLPLTTHMAVRAIMSKERKGYVEAADYAKAQLKLMNLLARAGKNSKELTKMMAKMLEEAEHEAEQQELGGYEGETQGPQKSSSSTQPRNPTPSPVESQQPTAASSFINDLFSVDVK